MKSRRSWAPILALALLLCAISVRSWALGFGPAAGQNLLSQLINGLFNNLLYALTAALELALYGIWVVVTWAVVRLYSGIGTYLIPIWDFSNGLGFFQASESAAMVAVGAPQAAAQLLQSMVPWILSLCGLLMFGLAALDIPRSLKAGQEPFGAVGGLAISAGFMVAFPLLYSVPIHIGDFLGREFYEASHEQYALNSGWGANGSPPSLFAVLLEGSIFPQSSSAVQPAGFNAESAIVSGASSALSLSSAQGISSTSQLEADFSNLSQQLSSNGNMSLAWSAAKEAVMYNLEMQASRFIQVILGVMALVALVGLLMLKGAQVVALVLSYYLGWIACALYVHPATRPVFGAWLKNHLRLCLWGLLWAFLIFVMDIIVVASQGLPGMVQQAGAAPGVFMGVGMFLMPFMLFAAIHKFKQVGELADSLSATGRIATGAGRSVHEAFIRGREEVPVGLVEAGGRFSAHGKVGTATADAGVSFAQGMEKVATSASKAVAAVPGFGPAASFALREGLGTVGALGALAAEAGGKAVRGANRFHGGPREYQDFVDASQIPDRSDEVQDLRPEQRGH